MSAALHRALSLLSRSVSKLALNPAVTAALLYVLTQGPAALREKLRDRFVALRDPVRHATFIRVLKWLLALGVLKLANKTLNHLALNNYRLRAATQRWDWNREVAVVTGGSSGIGSLIVQGLVAKGVTVAVLDVQPLPSTMQDSAQVHFYACDISDPEAVEDAAAVIKKELGSPSILINNAGVLAAHTILATSHEYLKKVFDVNVLGVWSTVKAFLPDMIKQDKGHVVTVASGASYVSVAGMADYTSSKAAVLAFHEALNQELRLWYNAPSILTTSIHPSWVRTPLIAKFEAELEKRGAAIVEPSDVADAVVAQVFSCRGAQVFVPRSGEAVALLRALPNWVQEGVRKGVSQTIADTVTAGGV